MRAGELRHVIAIEQKSLTSDGMGGNAQAWVAFASDVRAEIEPKTGAALYNAMQAGINNPVTVTMRYRPGVTGAMRINYRGAILSILSISDPEMLHRDLVIECGEKIA